VRKILYVIHITLFPGGGIVGTRTMTAEPHDLGQIEQMVEILSEADRDGAPAIAKRRGVSEQTHVEEAVWNVPAGRRATTEAAGGGESAAEEAGDGTRSRDRGHEGDRRKKWVSVPAPTAGSVRPGRVIEVLSA
jgi:hypothetical protein